MRRFSSSLSLLAVCLGTLSVGCEAGGVGDPCIPEDEYNPNFSGFDETEVNVESRSFQCETRVCLVANFRGRVSCPYGQLEGESNCKIPGTGNEAIMVPVRPQLVARRPDDAVYCSCRCAGDDENARYCECPSGFACRDVVPDPKLGSAQLAGSYCIREGTEVDNPKTDIPPTECNRTAGNCKD